MSDLYQMSSSYPTYKTSSSKINQGCVYYTESGTGPNDAQVSDVAKCLLPSILQRDYKEKCNY